MKYEVDGKEIEIPDEALQEHVKQQGWFNETLDSVRDKGFKSAIAKAEAEKAELEAKYQQELESAKMATSSKASEREQAYLDRLASIEQSLKEEREARQSAETNAKLSTVKNDVSNALADVSDEFYRNGLTREAMEAYDITTGSFTLQTGESGTVADLVEQYKAKYPQQFKSKQPNGLGIKGGFVPELPSNATPEQKRIARINASFGK